MDGNSTITIIVSLIGIVGSMVACLVWIVKRQTSQIERALHALTEAVDAFRRFEAGEASTHASIIGDMRQIVSTQLKILELIESINNHLNGKTQT